MVTNVPLANTVNTIKVLIVDDHHIVRAGLRAALSNEPGVEVVSEASDGYEAETAALEFKPDVITMDLFMPRRSGLEAMLAIKQKLPSAKVLFLTISEQEEDLAEAVRLGADGYLLKKSSVTEIEEAVRRVASGEAVLSAPMAGKLMKELRDQRNGPPLSGREKEVLQLLGEGLSTSDIAQRLFLSQGTVATYIGRLLKKLHLRNRPEAILYAARHLPTKGAPLSR